ncbi:Protein OS-9 like [Quillaja saponaria]|uniref:Protein OS-9 like n=1 Tax=Quillaja saponaria TaxID=32244 RepID=A0AAD7PCN2_QUISA|nr:Protein OS-9 like [Quillaja saponaria]
MATDTTLPKISSALFTILLILSLLLSSPPVLAKSRRPISDAETRQKKNDCYADIESGLWGLQCKSSMIAKENCALRCLSPECYEIIYGSDPLEEGEKDLFRGQEFKYCMHKISLGESLEGIKGSFSY